MKLSAKVLDFMYQNNIGDAIVGPYNNEREVARDVAAYNRSRDWKIKHTQKKILVIDPNKTAQDCQGYWKIAIIGAEAKPRIKSDKRNLLII